MESSINLKNNDNQNISIFNYSQEIQRFESWVSNSASVAVQFNVSGPPQSDDDGSLAWLAANLEELSKRYGDKWVLVRASTVIGESTDPIQLETLAKRKGIANPYITKVPSPSKSWRTAYGDRTSVR